MVILKHFREGDHYKALYHCKTLKQQHLGLPLLQPHLHRHTTLLAWQGKHK